MTLARVIRNLPDKDSLNAKQIVMPKANLDLDGKVVRLSGPGYGGSIEGILLETHNSYMGADYDIRLVVLTEWGLWYRELFQRERWLVTFLIPGKENLQ